MPIVTGDPAPRADVPTAITVSGAKVHNLKNLDVTVPLRQLVAIGGVSGSGKSSLAMGVLYAEGSRRYLEALSTYTRRRMSQVPRAAVDSVQHVPAALALRQRPGPAGVRSTFGTSTELLNVVRLTFSRLGSHLCPNGHLVGPTIDVAADLDLTCPVCAASFSPPSAESFAFNSGGACPTCAGTGIVREVDEASLVPDTSLTIAEGAVKPWAMFGLTVMPQVVAEFGVRPDVPYRDLTIAEHDIVMHGPEEKKLISVPSKNGKLFDLNFTYRNARRAVTEALDGASTEKGLNRINRFITAQTCSDCLGTRLSARARETHVAGLNLAEVTAKTLDGVVKWIATVPETVPADMRQMARGLGEAFVQMSSRLTELGLGYLCLDRASSTLSTGERQRVHLARAVRSQTTGVLYVLDEPSIGLHPANVTGLVGVIRDLLRDGNSVVLVDHDTQVLREADWLIEIGPGSGNQGGTVLSTGTVADLSADPESLLGPFLAGTSAPVVRRRADPALVFDQGAIHVETAPVHTVHALQADVPRGRLTVVTGVSGSGKTTLVLDSLVPALETGDVRALPTHVLRIDAPGIDRVNVIDATPIGVNVRSTVATYSGILDDLRRTYAADHDGLTAADFSYNTGSLRCPRCEGTGQIVLDVQFLPDVDIACPGCDGTRYAPQAHRLGHLTTAGTPYDPVSLSLPEVLGLTVTEAVGHFADVRRVRTTMQGLIDLGLGYLTLGESTPALSGGEAQRLKLGTELHRNQTAAIFVLDEPSVGLHPLDVRTLLDVLQRLLDQGATVVVIEHDLDLIANADHIIDLGPGGGVAGGHIVATGTPDEIARSSQSLTGRYLAEHLRMGQ